MGINLLLSKRIFFWNGGFIGECRLRNEGMFILKGWVFVFIEIFFMWWILCLKKYSKEKGEIGLFYF